MLKIERERERERERESERERRQSDGIRGKGRRVRLVTVQTLWRRMATEIDLCEVGRSSETVTGIVFVSHNARNSKPADSFFLREHQATRVARFPVTAGRPWSHSNGLLYNFVTSVFESATGNLVRNIGSESTTYRPRCSEYGQPGQLVQQPSIPESDVTGPVRNENILSPSLNPESG